MRKSEFAMTMVVWMIFMVIGAVVFLFRPDFVYDCAFAGQVYSFLTFMISMGIGTDML